MSGQDGLWVLARRARAVEPGRTAQRTEDEEDLRRLCESFDLVLVDSPPLLPVTDAVVLSKQVDGGANGRGPRSDQASRTTAGRREAQPGKSPVIGIVLDGVTKQSG